MNPKEIYNENKKNHILIKKQESELTHLDYCDDCYRIIEKDNTDMIIEEYRFCIFHNSGENCDENGENCENCTKTRINKEYTCECGKKRSLGNKKLTCKKCYSIIPKKIKIPSDFFTAVDIFYCNDFGKKCTGHFEFSHYETCSYGINKVTNCKGSLKMKTILEKYEFNRSYEIDVVDKNECFYSVQLTKSLGEDSSWNTKKSRRLTRTYFELNNYVEKEKVKLENNKIVKLLNELNTQKNSEICKTLLRENLECSICHDSIHDSLIITSCYHGFHSECLSKWNDMYKNNCPMCRNENTSISYKFEYNSEKDKENPKYIYNENMRTISILKKKEKYLDSLKYCGASYYTFGETFGENISDDKDDDACYRVIDLNNSERITTETEFCKIHENSPTKIIKNYLCECGKKENLSNNIIDCKECIDLIPEYINEEEAYEFFDRVELQYCNINENNENEYASLHFLRINYKKDDNCPGHFAFSNGQCHCNNRYCSTIPFYMSDCEKEVGWCDSGGIQIKIDL